MQTWHEHPRVAALEEVACAHLYEKFPASPPKMSRPDVVRPVATLVALAEPGNERVYVALSVLHPPDQFCRRVGRSIAAGRARKIAASFLVGNVSPPSGRLSRRFASRKSFDNFMVATRAWNYDDGALGQVLDAMHRPEAVG